MSQITPSTASRYSADSEALKHLDSKAPPPERPIHYANPTANRPPRWLWRALALVVVFVFLGIGAWNAMSSLSGLLVNLVIAFFISLALEPIVLWMVRRNVKRGLAAFIALFGGIIAVIGIFGLFGNLFIGQLIQLVRTLPDLWTNITTWVTDRWDVQIPDTDALLNEVLNAWGTDVASGAIRAGTSVVGVLFAALTIGLVTYYLLAAGPKFRAEICRYLTPNRQTEMLRMWEITQTKVSDFINSRVVLAGICTLATGVFLMAIGTPYALPLALFTGLTGQFVPTIGTYIGGALPVVVALTNPDQGPGYAVGVLAFIIGYQQVENLWLSPKISADALEMNPAVSFISVLAFGSVFGALGAFLALPVAATIQAIINTYVRRHELIESALLSDPAPLPRETSRGAGGSSSKELPDGQAADAGEKTNDEKANDENGNGSAPDAPKS